MHILVTNDDGVHAPGIAALAAALRSVGRVTVLAPDRNWSASGHVKTLHKPLRLKATTTADGEPAFASSGAPSDCVALAVLGAVEGPIDLVVSGINPVCNLGHDVTYSGTVTAAMEAAVWDIPAIAVSMNGDYGHFDDLDYRPAATIARRVAEGVIRNGLPPKTLLNVNVPAGPLDQMRGQRVTRQGHRVYYDELVVRDDPRGHPYYWFGGDEPGGTAEPGTDLGAVANEIVSITPLRLDLTAVDLLNTLRDWGLERDDLSEEPAEPGRAAS
jgi:5'-nucleotidase